MHYRAFLILLCMFSQVRATFMWEIDTVLSKYAEDSLVIRVSSDSPLPALELRHGEGCATALHAVSRLGIPGTEWTPEKGAKKGTWVTRGNQIPAGPLCIQPYDSQRSLALANAKSILRPSNKRHQLLRFEKDYPWSFWWSRPTSIPWTRVKIGIRDIESGKERTLYDYWTTSLQSSLGMAHIGLHWVRLANAYDSSSAATDTNSWTVFPLSVTSDTLLPPILLAPTSGATFARNQLDDGIEFNWNTHDSLTENQLLLFKYDERGWTLLNQFTTTSQEYNLPVTGLSAGRYQWMVTNQDHQGRIGQSSPREFQLNGDLQEYTLQLLVNGKPINGANIYCTLKNGKSSKILRSSSINATAGIIQFESEPGNATFELHSPGFPIIVKEITLPVTSNEIIPISLQTSGTGFLAGIICDTKGLPLAGISLELTQSYGEKIFLATDYNGTFQAELTPGNWHWKVAPYDSGTVLIQRNQSVLLDTIHANVNWIVLQGNTKPGTTIEAIGSDEIKVWSTKSSQRGYFQLSIPAGSYKIRANCSGYIPWTIHGYYAVSQLLTIPLQKGVAILSGRVNSLEEKELGTPELTAVMGAEIWTWLENSSDTLKGWTGNLGEFRLNLPQAGKWFILARKNGKQTNIYTAIIEMGAEEQIPDLLLQYQARIKGTLVGIPTTAQAPRVWITSGGNTKQILFAKQNRDQIWEYEFTDVPQGTYQVIVRAAGFIPLDTPQVSISNLGRQEVRGTMDIPPIQLTNSLSQLAIHSRFHVFGRKSISSAFSNTQGINANLVLQMPSDTGTRVPDTLTIGRGAYQYSLIPDDHSWIALWQQHDSLIQDFDIDTILWPGRHLVPDTIYPQKGDTISIKLERYEPTDSIHLHILDGAQYLSLQPTITYEDSLIFRFTMEHPSPKLKYWFDIYSSTDGRHYSNPAPFLHFQTQIHWTSLPFTIHTNIQDTLRVLTSTDFPIQISATSLFGNEILTDRLRDMGTITWTLTPNSGIVIQNKPDDPLTLQISIANPGTYSLDVHAKLDNQTASRKFILIAQNKITGHFQIHSLWDVGQIETPRDPIPLQATITDTLNQDWIVPAAWSNEPENAGSISTDGLLRVDSAFIGNIEIKASYDSNRDSMVFPVYQWIYPNQPSTMFHYDSNIQIFVADSAVHTTPVAIGLDRFLGLRKTKFNRHGKDTLNGFFNLTFPLHYPDRIPTIAFQIPPEKKNNPEIYSLDSNVAYFENIPREEITDSTADSWIGIIPKKGIPTYYGILQDPNKSLSTSLSFMPNPFSPNVISHIDGNTEAGTAIHFTPYYPGLQQTFTSLEILSISGDPIRVLLKNKVYTTEKHTLYWDGTTDSGHMVHNGRYIAILSLRKTANGKIIRQLAKPVVVFR